MKPLRQIAVGLLGLLMAFGLLSHLGAEVQGGNSVSSTSTSATVSMATAVTALTIINDEASANEAYLRVFWCGEPTLAATTSSPIRLEPGESVQFKYNAQSEGARSSGLGYCAFSHVTTAAETATLRWIGK